MPNMTDRANVVAPTMDFWLHGSAAPTAPTQPEHLRLMTTAGSNTSNGAEATSVNCPGYTATGVSLGNPAFAANASGVSASSQQASWTATGGWAAINGIEVWDSAGTAKRILQGAITQFTLSNGNTVNFAAGAVTADASTW